MYNLLNYMLFQIGWFACVRAGAAGEVWSAVGAVAVILLVHLSLVEDRAGELRLIVLCAALGPWVDWYLVQRGVYAYVKPTIPAWPAPAWIIALWALLAMTPRHCLRWLAHRPSLAFLLGAVGGPLSYKAGESLGALRFGEAAISVPLAMGVAWGLAMPALFWLAKPRKSYA